MVAHVLRLRATLLLGALRGDPRDVVRRVAGLVIVVAATAATCWGILSLQDAPTSVAQTVIVVAGAAVTLAFALAPLIAGMSDPLDPRRFGVFGLAPRPLAGALVLAGVISMPMFVLAALAVCVAIVWSAHGVPVLIAVLAALLAVLTCVLLTRVCMALAALVLRERRSRELSGLFALVVLVVVVPVAVFIASLEWKGEVPIQLETAAAFLSRTPFAAAWGFPGTVAAGDAGAAWFVGAVVLLTVLLLGWAWLAIVARLLTTLERPAARERGGLGWFAVLPGTPAGAIAARSLIYWMRDRRYLVNIVIVPIAAAVVILPLLVAGVPGPTVALVPVPIIALFFGWMPHNDVAYDSTAIWMHIASGTRGFADRVGRLAPILLLGVVTLAVLIPISIAVHGRWAMLPAMIGVCASLLLTGVGLSSISSVVAPYPVTSPGDSPFRQPQRSGSSGVLAQGLVLIGAVLLSIPALWWGWLSMTENVSYATSALLGGVGVGVLVLIVGVSVGGTLFDRRGDQLMEFAEST